MIHFFSSANSFNSILTIDKKSKEGGSDSIFDVAEELELDKIFLVEKNPSSFPQALKNANERGFQLVYGLKLTVCDDSDKKDTDSISTEHKLIFFANTGRAYKQCLMKLYSDAATRGNYNGLPRTDFKRIKQFWGDEMTMVVPFYGNFLEQNLMKFNSCIPKFDGFDPIFAVESHDLPYDGFMRQKMEGYAKEGGYEVVEAHSTYYRAKEDFLSYLTYKCIQNRSSIECPNLEGMCSENFFAIKS